MICYPHNSYTPFLLDVSTKSFVQKNKEIIKEVKSRIPTLKDKDEEKARKFIQSNLTDRNNGFFRYAEIPATEDNGRPLIEIIRSEGLRFNNKTG